jgi:hypothetical protein
MTHGNDQKTTGETTCVPCQIEGIREETFEKKSRLSMDFHDWISGLLGAGVGAGTTLFATKKKETRSDFTELVDKWKTIYDEVQRREHKCDEELRQVRSELLTIQKEIIEVKRQMPGK